jgi:hypothetical protein
MGADDNGIDVDVPGDQALGVSPGLQLGKDPLPGAVPLPPAEEVVDPAPWPVLDRYVPPRDAGADPNRIPSISCRLVHIGGRPDFLPLGNSGSSTAHSPSVRSPRATNQDHLALKIHFQYT